MYKDHKPLRKSLSTKQDLLISNDGLVKLQEMNVESNKLRSNDMTSLVFEDVQFGSETKGIRKYAQYITSGNKSNGETDQQTLRMDKHES